MPRGVPNAKIPEGDVKVRVKRDGVWLKENERSDKGDEGTIDAALAETLKEAGFVDIL